MEDIVSRHGVILYNKVGDNTLCIVFLSEEWTVQRTKSWRTTCYLGHLVEKQIIYALKLAVARSI
jgi:hypothetical protein